MNKKFTPDYSRLGSGDYYAGGLETELFQCRDEGLDIASVEPVIEALIKMPVCAEKEKLADTVFDIISEARLCPDYKYVEPSDYDSIMSLCDKIKPSGKIENLRDRIAGAWYGRIAGCLLGKTVEGICSDEFIPFLKATGNYPMHRYITTKDAENPICEDFKFWMRKTVKADSVACAPCDDDTNYMILAWKLIREKGRAFTPDDVMDNWIANQPKNAYWTAERVALVNSFLGIFPPYCAEYKNPYREYIGAQIRIDYYAYINPGNPEAAANMAFRDASISHIKNGIYGAMYCAAMISSAVASDNIREIINIGLSYVPKTSRLYEFVRNTEVLYDAGKSYDDFLEYIRRFFAEKTNYGWCHVIPNACIVTAALLWGGLDYSKSICLAVQSCYDTDCNGATVGSILGMLHGRKCVGDEWTVPLRGKLATEIVRICDVSIEKMIDDTLKAAEE